MRTHYLLTIDKGTVDIVKGVARAIREKGVNVVHLYKEAVPGGYLTGHQAGNISRPRFHGLVARSREGGRGNFVLTRKGAAFLNGQAIAKTAVIKKSTENEKTHNAGYLDDETVTIHDFDGEWSDYWKGEGYEISEGVVVPARSILERGKDRAEEDSMQPLFG